LTDHEIQMLVTFDVYGTYKVMSVGHWRQSLFIMDVRLELASGDDHDEAEGEARCVRRPRQELDVSDPVTLAGRNDDRS
jgi:hypothetical protein